MAQLREKCRIPAATGGDVLLVDDDANHRELYARRLGRLGYTVRAVAGAEEALEATREAMPEAVVLDIAMPGRDGLSLLQELIALQPSLPVIIHTAYPTFRDNFLTWMADAYIEKSSDLGPLAEAIEAALRDRAVA